MDGYIGETKGNPLVYQLWLQRMLLYGVPGRCRASALMDHPNDALSLDEAVCTLYRDGWLARIQERVSQLRPTAVCVERELLRRAGREDEMPC